MGYEDLLEAIEEAKTNNSHETTYMFNDNLLLCVKNGLISMNDYMKGFRRVLEENGCSMSFDSEGTINPLITIRYNG